MAIKNSRAQTQTLTLVSILTIIISFLSLAQNVNSASFSFPSFGSSYTNDITLQGDAYVNSEGTINLTPITPRSSGRASYASPVHLWDSKTGKLAGFNTSFSFLISPTGPGLFGDGIAFFLTPFTSYIPDNSTGGYLGLFSPDTALNVYKNQIVAVEFDTFSGNPWDPPSAHVGIDVNSIASVTTTRWQPGNSIVVDGLIAYATLNYEPVEKTLNVLLRYPGTNLNATSLSFVIDLRTVLPEWVRVGFSGATGQLVELHKIFSWSFTSSFI